MKTPNRLQPLLDAHLIDDVLGQLQSGKEADVYIVYSEGEYRCAKVYKDANNRSFKQMSQYTEGRSVRNSRKGRAMASNSRFGKQEREREWQSAEVDALSMLAGCGVRVPKTYMFYEGVLLLEMITDTAGQPALRLSDVKLNAELARAYHLTLIKESVLMLCAGIVHGDYSEFNVLVGKDGLVIIDLPQAVQATANNAFAIFERDLIQLSKFFGRYAPDIVTSSYPKEIWKLYEMGKLKPDTKLTGLFKDTSKKANVASVLEEIDAAKEDEMKRRLHKRT